MSGGRFIISGTDARHIVRVLRLGPGDTLRVVTGEGRSHLARIEKASQDAVECSIISAEKGIPARGVAVTLVQAVPKGKAMEPIIRKATELGVATIVPLETERCVSRLKGDKAGQRLQRWRKIAAEAAKQCSRFTIPEVTSIKTLPELLQDHGETGLKIMLYEEEKTNSLRQALSGAKGAGQVNILVGAEGGFSPQEVETARGGGYITVSLGPRILRTDTASLALLSILMYELEDLEP